MLSRKPADSGNEEHYRSTTDTAQQSTIGRNVPPQSSHSDCESLTRVATMPLGPIVTA